MDRRTFMKLMGGLASMPIIGRIAKPLKSETVQEGIAAVSDKGMQLYEMVVAKVMKEGKKIGESGRVDSYKHPDRPDITVDVNQTDGSAEIYFDTDKGSKGFAEIRRDMETGGDELIEAEEVYKFFGKDGEDYVKDVEEGISGGITNLEEFTRLKKAMGGRVGYQTGGTSYNPRATTQDFANALRSVSAGTTYQQQRQAKDYARQEASNLLSQAMRSGNQGNIQSILQGIGGSTTIPGMQFNRSGNRITSVPATGPGRNAILNAMANQMLSTTSYAAPDPFQKRIDELDKIKAENQRLVNQYMQNNPSLLGAGIAQLNTAGSTPPSPPKPAYMDQTLLSQLTKLTPEQATLFDPFDQLSDLDQYNLSQAYPELQSQLRDSSYVSPYGLQSDQELFNRRYGLKDGGSVDLTIITMPDISGSGVESLFKTR
jgi:hypothetical protein